MPLIPNTLSGLTPLVGPQNVLTNELLERKLKHIRSTGATIVATGNPGCLLQLTNGAKQQNLDLRVVHPVTLLAEAYRSSLSK
ncbi:MAG TPA: (Fe-S)-binding protein [Candidatus Binatia bacterium]|jgi:glycolate oxidase iron-sulfur subunit|nr:(Fe-S)-binding protein [Candidatus Binatia bacterium]